MDLLDMDHKMVKKFRKRKDLDKLLMGNARKHFRKKSGHVLLRSESQSSSSDDLENFKQLSVIQYRRSRCSSFILYASICLSICTLTLCCVLFGLTFISRSHIIQLQSDVQTVSEATKMKTAELQDIYSRLQTLQVYVHEINRNLTKQRMLFTEIKDRFNGLQKRFRKFEGFETLLGSLSNVPARIEDIKSANDQCCQSVNGMRKDLNRANQQINDLTSRITSMHKKDVKNQFFSKESNTSKEADMKINQINRSLELLRYNVTEVRDLIMDRSYNQKSHGKVVDDKRRKNESQNHVLLRRMDAFELQLTKMKNEIQSVISRNKSSAGDSAMMLTNLSDIRSSINSNKKSIVSLQNVLQHTSTLQKKGHDSIRLNKDGEMIDLALENLNSTLSKLVERLPGVKMTLGFGVSSNATFIQEPLGQGVVLKRDEYFKLRSFWAKASTAFTLGVQSQQRVKSLERKFKKLRKQVIDAVQDISVLQAVGLKPTDKPGGKHRADMDINVPIPVYTTPRDPNAPTPDPHLKLPWVKSARDAEINFLRWNRNGDDALSGEELDPAALRGFMGPYTPTLEQMMHFDVNNDHRLSKDEVLCLFGYIPWPCTGEVVTPTPATYQKVSGRIKVDASGSISKATKKISNKDHTSPTSAPQNVKVSSRSTTTSPDDTPTSTFSKKKDLTMDRLPSDEPTLSPSYNTSSIVTTRSSVSSKDRKTNRDLSEK